MKKESSDIEISRMRIYLKPRTILHLEKMVGHRLTKNVDNEIFTVLQRINKESEVKH